jgi:hypothetical protein
MASPGGLFGRWPEDKDDVPKARKNAELMWGLGIFFALMAVLVILLFGIASFAFGKGEGLGLQLLGLLGMMLAIQAGTLVGRERYHRRLLEERVAALEARS